MLWRGKNPAVNCQVWNTEALCSHVCVWGDPDVDKDEAEEEN